MGKLLSEYTLYIKRQLSMTEVIKHVQNGFEHNVIIGTEFNIDISNELGTEKFRISISFHKSKKTFYIDLLMRYDNECKIIIPESNISLQMQFNYIKEQLQNIVNEIWCETVMKNLRYDENEFIKSLNSLGNKV